MRNADRELSSAFASLGEMVGMLRSQSVRVPPGFAITANAYWTFVRANGLETQIRGHLADLGDGKASLDGFVLAMGTHKAYPQWLTNGVIRLDHRIEKETQQTLFDV